MTSYYSKIRKFISEIEEHPKCSVEYLDFVPIRQRNMNNARLSELEKRLGESFPIGIYEFYKEVESFEFKWRVIDEEVLKIDSHITCGAISIRPAYSIFSKPLRPYYKQTPNFIPVDYFTSECAVGYNLNEDKTFPSTLSVAFHNEIHPLYCTFMEYFEKLLNARGYVYWVYGLVDTRDQRKKGWYAPGYEESQMCGKVLPLLFPDIDLEMLLPFEEKKLDKAFVAQLEEPLFR